MPKSWDGKGSTGFRHTRLGSTWGVDRDRRLGTTIPHVLERRHMYKSPSRACALDSPKASTVVEAGHVHRHTLAGPAQLHGAQTLCSDVLARGGRCNAEGGAGGMGCGRKRQDVEDDRVHEHVGVEARASYARLLGDSAGAGGEKEEGGDGESQRGPVRWPVILYSVTRVTRRRRRHCFNVVLPARRQRRRARARVESWESGADLVGERSIEERTTKAAQAWSTGAEAKGRYKLRMGDDVHGDRRAKAASAPHPSSFHQLATIHVPILRARLSICSSAHTSSSSASLSGGKISALGRLHRGDSASGERSKLAIKVLDVGGGRVIGLARRTPTSPVLVRLYRSGSGSKRGRAWVVGQSWDCMEVLRRNVFDDTVETEGEVDEDQKRHPLVRLGEMAIAGKANTRQRPGRRRDNLDAREVALLRTEGIVAHGVVSGECARSCHASGVYMFFMHEAAPGDVIQGVGTASRSGKSAVGGVRIWCRRGGAVRTQSKPQKEGRGARMRYASRRRARMARTRGGRCVKVRGSGLHGARGPERTRRMTDGLRWGFSGKEMTVPRHRGAGGI
ncbi:hypothetical protein DFH08DRAFT_824849 [Mycena albidolilacea]|uniref:Uncharacterized protein n=1 Tax=Mycena albidolilacea TaxID=1033008 RepID=A0AAD6Z3Y0_9AGAR|nr:hypothetical protein DFH08DRAFT_824849 [Mycena albidolilacea]